MQKIYDWFLKILLLATSLKFRAKFSYKNLIQRKVIMHSFFYWFRHNIISVTLVFFFFDRKEYFVNFKFQKFVNTIVILMCTEIIFTGIIYLLIIIEMNNVLCNLYNMLYFLFYCFVLLPVFVQKTDFVIFTRIFFTAF